MKNTLRISFSLKNTYLVNGILYSLKQIPLIKKLLPQSLYSVKGLKIFANIIAVICEIFLAFFGKFLYFSATIFSALIIYEMPQKQEIFLHLLIFLSLVGASMNTYLFNPTKDKYYAVILLRMNAKEYAIVNYLYSIFKVLIGFLAFGILFGTMSGVPLWICILIPFFVASLKATVAAYSLRKYEKTGEPVNENNPGKLLWTLIALGVAAAYIPPFINIALPLWVSVLFMAITIIVGIFSFKKIFTFTHYRACYQQLLQNVVIQKEMLANAVRKQSSKMISADTTLTSKRKGFEYLNELFIKRHQKILWKASKKITFVCIALFAVAITACFVSPIFNSQINSFIVKSLPWCTFIMYMLNRGTGFTQVSFVNCDHSLLTYSFYKQPKFVLKLFFIRLREIVKVNLLPAVIIGLGLAALLYASGGTNDVLNYVGIILTVPALSVFFSVHYLTIYYLLQPYNAGTEIKSATYQIIMTVTYFACFYIMRLKVSALLFGIVAIAFCFIYCAVACALVYKIAPKTFKLRN